MSPNVSPAQVGHSQVGHSQVGHSQVGPPQVGQSRASPAPNGASPSSRSTPDLSGIPDDELIGRLRSLIADSRRVEADLVAHLGEVDARRLFAREAVPSMFEYCTRVLRFSEQEAYLRITVARCSRQHPLILPMLRDGRLHLSGVARLAPHLTDENARHLLERAAGLTKREVEEMLAEIAPRPDAVTIVRKLPERLAPTAPTDSTRGRVDAPGDAAATFPPSSSSAFSSAASVPAVPSVGVPSVGGESVGPTSARTPSIDTCVDLHQRTQLGPDRVECVRLNERSPVARVEPLAPGRYRVQFTASAVLRDKLERLRALMRASVPDGDLAAVIEAAVTEKIERLEARRFARVKAPRQSLVDARTTPASRSVPAAVRRAVHARDGGQCTYRDAAGRRCPARDDLELHHRVPFGFGGGHEARTLGLMCRAHNALMAEHDYGRAVMARFRRSGGRGTPPPGSAGSAGSAGAVRAVEVRDRVDDS
jgi:5-methylcytosine-specific restriction endonuclease McrA